jgi:L,D-transpeptidase catalytic domain
LAVGLALLAVALPAQARASDGPRFLLVSAPHGATVRSSPGGATVAHLPAVTPLGAPTWLWVLRTTPNHRWGRVVLPLKPNGRTGWINLRGLRTVHTSTWIRASLHARRIWLMHGSRPRASFSAAIGAVTTPTPIGRFSVTDSLATGDPSGPFGWYAFGLSGHQPRLPPGWSGGDQLAIHGTDDPASIGTPASHGCLRVSPRALARLRPAVRLGTPVVIMRTADRAMVVARASAWPQPPAPARPPAARPAVDGFPTVLVLRVMQSVLTATLVGSASLHTVAPMAATAPPAVLPRRVNGPAHRHGLRTHSTPIRYPHSLRVARPGLYSVGLRRLPVG